MLAGAQMAQQGEQQVQEVAEQVEALVSEQGVMVSEQGVAEVVLDAVQVVESLVVKAIELEMAGEVVEAQAVVQEAQEELEAQEVQEVQDHHSHHLSPDHAALALLAHRCLVVLHRQGLQERPHRRGAGQRH